MPGIKKDSTLLKEVYLINLSSEDGLQITPMLDGAHGIGKSAIVRSAIKDMNGYCLTVEGSQLSDGDIIGLPVASKTLQGDTEVNFVKYYAIARIFALEQEYYRIATTKGFLNGSVKLKENEDGTKSLVEGKLVRTIGSKIENIFEGKDNSFKFGKELTPATKVALVESGEIKPVFLFIDELNRADPTVMKQLMNVILNKSVNGYELPWWVNIVSAINPCSQNSSYATNELDDAQLDRFLKIRTDANITDWIDYGLEKHINSDVLEGLANTEDIFIHRESGQVDESEMSPSPRSWEMVAHIYEELPNVVKSKFFTDEERAAVSDDLRVLIRGKVGETAARTLLESINRKENNIKPAEILTCKAPVIDPEVITKFNKQKKLTQKIISDNLVNYISEIVDDVIKLKASPDATKKKTYMNFMSQLKDFANHLDTATQILFVKKIISVGGNTTLFRKVASAFSVEILSNLTEAKKAIEDLTSDNK